MPQAGDGKRATPKVRAARGQKKQQLLDCARHLFAEFGYSGSSLDQIAEHAGVSRSVVSKSFPDKPAVLKAIGEEWLAALFVEETAAERSPIDVVNRLLAFSEQLIASLNKDEPTGRIILSGLTEPSDEEESTIIHATLQVAIDKLVPVMRAGQQSGVVRREIDTRQVVIDWLRFLLGAALLPSAAANEGDLPTQIIETLLHGVLKTDV